MRTTCLGLTAFLLLAACESDDTSSDGDSPVGEEASNGLPDTSGGVPGNSAGGASEDGGNVNAGTAGTADGSEAPTGSTTAPTGGSTGAGGGDGDVDVGGEDNGEGGGGGFAWPSTDGGFTWPTFGGDSGGSGGGLGGLWGGAGTTGTGGAGTTGAGGAGTTGTGGTDTDGTGGMGTDSGGANGGSSASCPAGFESELDLVLTGETVPGSVELGLASTPETPRAPCGLPGDQECFNLLNAERAKEGLAPRTWDGDLADLARSHAADRSQRRYVGSQHGSSTNGAHLYENRASFLGLKSGKFASVVENSVTGASTASAAVRSWMFSSGHRSVIMGEGAWAPYTYAACAGNGREWNIEFGRAGGAGGFGGLFGF